MSDEELNPNPIVAAAMRIRARHDISGAIDSAMPGGERIPFDDAEVALRAFAAQLDTGVRRLNSILGNDGVKLIRLERPLRIRLRFRELRIGLDLDEMQQLVKITGLGLDGEYQFDTASEVPALINLSQISTEAGYGKALTPSGVMKAISKDAQLKRPAHLDGPGPIPL